MIKNQCLGTSASVGGVAGGMRRGRRSPCPVCKRRIAMRPGRAGRLYAHSAIPTAAEMRLMELDRDDDE